MTGTLVVRAFDGSQLSSFAAFKVTDPPAATVEAGKTLEIATSSSGSVAFESGTGTLKIDNSAGFSGTVAGMFSNDTLDLSDIDPNTVQTPNYNGDSTGGTLTVTDGSHTANIGLIGNYMASTFTASSDGHGGTNVVDVMSTNQTTLLSQPSH